MSTTSRCVVGFLLFFGWCMLAGSDGYGEQADPEMIVLPKQMRMGLIPAEGGLDTIERFQPLVKHLQQTMGTKIEVISAANYADVIHAMTEKRLDLAYFGPKSYIRAAEKAGAQAVAVELNKKGAPGYHGLIISKRGSGIRTMEQAKGRHFAFTDPDSTTGWLIPNVLFHRDMTIDPEVYFGRISYSGSHADSILGVQRGTYDATATNQIDLDRMIEKGLVAGSDFNILWKSKLIPGAPMCVRKDLPEVLKAAFRGALIAFQRDRKGLDKMQIGGYAYADDETYDVIRYLDRLQVKLKKQQAVGRLK